MGVDKPVFKKITGIGQIYGCIECLYLLNCKLLQPLS